LSKLDRRRQQVTFLTIEFYLRFLFARLDHASMLSGVEARVPYADHELLQYAYNVPWDMLNHGEPRQPKGLLREAVGRGLLPDEVVNRIKSGFPVSQSAASRTLLFEEASDILSTPTSHIHRFIDRQQVRKVMAESSLSSWNPLLHVGAGVVETHHFMADNNVHVC
jgi:asparagine synthase (glutamine-hydrolysing)